MCNLVIFVPKLLMFQIAVQFSRHYGTKKSMFNMAAGFCILLLLLLFCIVLHYCILRIINRHLEFLKAPQSYFQGIICHPISNTGENLAAVHDLRDLMCVRFKTFPECVHACVSSFSN